jgi:hypothetical protein
VLPNALPHIMPLFLHIIGAAMAAYGAIGLFGFVNRTELDLGVFLLRGKEQAGFDLTSLTLALAAYAVSFLCAPVADPHLGAKEIAMTIASMLRAPSLASQCGFMLLCVEIQRFSK